MIDEIHKTYRDKELKSAGSAITLKMAEVPQV